MNKTFRQGQILKLIASKVVLTQDDLAQELKDAYGIQTTQVTLSRDMRELGLVKTHRGYRQESRATSGPEIETVVSELLRDVRVAQNLIVLRTSPGNANALAAALDKQDWPEVVGTLAGDDTVLIVAPDARTATALQQKFLGYVQDH
jgi:transcriptional regulator of arginine metabolism